MSLDYLNCCRLCASSSENSIPIFQDVHEIDFADKIKNYLHIELIKVENDARMCEYCYQRIKDWDEYVTQVQKVQAMFSNFSNDISSIMENFTEPSHQDGKLVDESLEIILKTNAYEERVEVDSNEINKSRKRERKKVKKRKKKIRKKFQADVEDGFSEEDDIPLNNISFKSSNNKKIRLRIKPVLDINKEDSECEEEGYEESREEDGDDEETIEENEGDLKTKSNSFFFVWECHVCKLTCKNWNGLYRHCKEEHDVGAKVVCICGKELQSRASVMKHYTKHTTGYEYTCDYDNCGKKFHRQSLLDIHVVSHLPKELQPYMCTKCSRHFYTESLLKQHEKVHLPREKKLIHPCELCDKMFCSKSAVSAHLRAIHYKERPYVCDQCGHCFTSKGILQEHLTIHSNVFNYHCEECNKSFKTKYRLKIHIDTHRETRYECPVCNLTLNTRRTLRMHLLVHKDEKSHQCATCGKGFKRSKDLKNHNNLHTGRRPYICPFCMRTFANGSNCRSHKRRMHPDELKLYEETLASGQEPLIFHFDAEGNKVNGVDEGEEGEVEEEEAEHTHVIGGGCDGGRSHVEEPSPLDLHSRVKDVGGETHVVQTITLSPATNANLTQFAITGQGQGFHQYPIHNLYTFQQAGVPAFPGNPYFRP